MTYSREDDFIPGSLMKGSVLDTFKKKMNVAGKRKLK